VSPGAEIGRDQIEETYRVIHDHIRRTPTLDLDPGDLGIVAGQITLKLEYLQHAGSFKARGAFANLLLRDVGSAGVAAASGGNHGAAVAYAAHRLGIPAHIFIPSVAPQAKVDRIRSQGAELTIVGERYDDALRACVEFVEESGALNIHAFDQRETILGQGTVGLELDEQAPELDTLLVSVGGGGLIAGIASWYASRIKVIGVEPRLSPTLTMALDAGSPVDAPTDGIAADSLAPRWVGELVLPIARAHVAQVVLVEDDEIIAAQRALWDVARIVAEPGGAAATAALLSGRYTPGPDEHVGVLVSGANTDAVAFPAYPGFQS
jgi:threonine dehydratase